MKERKRLCLKNHDYFSKGAYFVTICSKVKGEIFGVLTENDQVFLNDIGLIVKKQWEWLEVQYPYISLDEFIIMPDHFHGIIWISDINTVDPVGYGHDVYVQHNCDCTVHKHKQKIKPVYDLIGTFKTTSSKLIHRYGYNEFKWQKSFYDNLIRDGVELYNIRNFIKYNELNHNNGVQLRLFTNCRKLYKID